MPAPAILVLATGGTIAGQAGDALRSGYQAGAIGIDVLLDAARAAGIAAPLVGRQIANVGSENIGPAQWRAVHAAAMAAMDDPGVGGILILHGTDTAEEAALLFDLTLPAAKPVVLVGAMRPGDAVGSDGLRNLANAVRVAGDADAAGRGVMVVMGDEVIAARDVRKARTTGARAFAGFPRPAIAGVTPDTLEWFGAPWRAQASARFAMPERFPPVAILACWPGMPAGPLLASLCEGSAGIVVAGFGAGTMPDAVRDALGRRAQAGLAVIRSSRVDEGLVDRDGGDDAAGFVAARALGPPKARILLQVCLANGIHRPAAIQAEFDRR